jgi:hypothetical protein
MRTAEKFWSSGFDTSDAFPEALHRFQSHESVPEFASFADRDLL